MEKESVDDCLSYFSLLAPSAETTKMNKKNEVFIDQINSKTNSNSNSKNSSTINAQKKGYIGKIGKIVIENSDSQENEIDEEEEKEASLTQMECSSVPRIPPLLFEKWYTEYFDMETEVNPLDKE